MFPDMNIGIFTTMTGDDPSYFFRTNINLFIADLLLGHEPWLNSSTVCSFPEPWKTKSKSSKTEVDKNIKSKRPLSDYEGVYENKAYGKMEVYFNVSNNRLMAKCGFGQMILYPKTTANQFYAEGYGIMKYLKDFSTFEFFREKANKAIVSLKAVSFDTKNPPVFEKTKDKSSERFRRNTGSRCVRSWLTLIALIVFAVYVF